jgi:hypothetical protein
MIPSVLICNGIVLLGVVIYSVFAAFDWRFLTGLLVGNAATLANFYYLGVKTANIVRMKEVRRARVYATVGFFLRYFGAFAVFGALVHFGLVNMITLLIPLFFPKIHYTIKALRKKEV